MNETIITQLKQAKAASREMMNVDAKTKEKALKAISKAIVNNIDVIIAENKKDISKARENGLSNAMIDRLLLNEERLIAISNDILKVIDLEDPIGTIVREIKRPNGLNIKQIRIPLGVIGIIYESRPNVTVDIATLCLKTNNVCVLKGGKEALHSNKILAHIMQVAIKGILPEHCINLIETTNREVVGELIQQNEYLDVVIPRGGAGLIQFVVKHATVPVIETGAGVCHLYVDKDADLKMAINIAVNSKIQRPSVCNAIETILVHKDIASSYLPQLKEIFDQHHTKLKGNKDVQAIINCEDDPDFNKEYGDYIANVKLVNSVEDAIDHIYHYSTKHSEAIITENKATAQLFMDALDSACIYWNASTRFSDGGEFGFGAEVGISTQKLHARGPLGLQEITSTKYQIYGKGQIR